MIPRYIHQATIEVEEYPGFYVDIVLDTKQEVYGTWLFHEDYGTKIYMYGFLVHPTPDTTETLRSVLVSVGDLADEYIPDYMEEYMD